MLRSGDVAVDSRCLDRFIMAPQIAGATRDYVEVERHGPRLFQSSSVHHLSRVISTKHDLNHPGFSMRVVSSTASRAVRFNIPFSSFSLNLSHLSNPSIEGRLNVSYPCLMILLIWRELGLLLKRPFDLSSATSC